MPKKKMPKKKMDVDSSSPHETSEETFMRLCLPEEGEDIEPHFFKIIIDPSLQLKQLRLPPEFTKESGSTLSNYAYLRAPGGNEQRVHLRKQGGNIWFTNGWKEFAELYSIEYGHFIVFRYQGNSRFNVFIFDTTCCEIKYPNFDTNTSDDDDDEDEDEDENWVVDEDDDEDEDDDDDGVSQNGNDNMPIDVALQRAKELECECDNPNFIVSMTHSYLGRDCRMWIPQGHAKEFLDVDENNIVVKLVREGVKRSWNVKVTNGDTLRFGSGWIKFAKDNCLEVEDVCLFELINRRALVYKVHVFRAS